MNYSERRNFPRPAIGRKAWLRSDAGTFQIAQTVDVHQHGAQLWANGPQSPDTLVDLHLKLQDGDPLRLLARVAWCRPDRQGGFRLGLAFPQQNSTDARRLLRWYYSRCLPRQQAV